MNLVVARLAAQPAVSKMAVRRVRRVKCSRLFALAAAAKRKFRSVQAATVRCIAAIASTKNKAVNRPTQSGPVILGRTFLLPNYYPSRYNKEV